MQKAYWSMWEKEKGFDRPIPEVIHIATRETAEMMAADRYTVIGNIDVYCQDWGTGAADLTVPVPFLSYKRQKPCGR